jgi:hypothetical protein
MTDTFVCGEIAIYVRPGSPYFGREVKILRALTKTFFSADHITGEKLSEWEMAYRIDGIKYGENFPSSAAPEHLKKKPQKRDIDELVSWDYLNDLMKKKVSA